MLFALLLKKLTELMSRASVSGGVFAKSSIARYLPNRPGVTLFTCTSVVWAERTVATSSSQGVEKRSAVRGVSEYSFLSRLMISATFSCLFMKRLSSSWVSVIFRFMPVASFSRNERGNERKERQKSEGDNDLGRKDFT